MASGANSFFFILGFAWFIQACMAGQIGIRSRLFASDHNQVWLSDNRTFAFGFSPLSSSGDNVNDRFLLAIWFAELPGDRTVIWSANRNSPVSKNAIVELDVTGNLVLTDGAAASVVWSSNTSGDGAEYAVMSESGNFILFNAERSPVWQSFSHPSDTLLPNQPLSVSLELTTSKSPSHGGYYTLKMLQQRTTLKLALTFNLPESYEGLPESYANYSYWSAPEISNVTGEVIAVLDEGGSFGVVYGDSSNGAVYVYKNDNDNGGLSASTNQSIRNVRTQVVRRLTLESNGNLRLYRWDDDVNGSRQWVPEWAAVSNPCDIAGICGNGICYLDKSKTNASCSCLPGTFKDNGGSQCFENSSSVGKCGGQNHQSSSTQFRISPVQQTNYYYSEFSVIANYSDINTVAKCGDACLTDCECVASVYGLDDEKPYCWVLRSLDFGGFEDAGSTLFVKVKSNGSIPEANGPGGGGDSSGSAKEKATVRTNNFSEVLGTGGFGSVYKGSLGDGTLVAVKKLDRVFPHGEKEFITEVNTIGSMHHMNLVRLCGYCSEGSHRLLVYEFMKNGSLDKWIFPSHHNQDRILDWSTRFHIAVGTAQGIAYFHEQCRNRIIHCDIKPENILLDENFCPKVSDFGLAKLMGREHSHVVTMVRGTRGYLAPEWVSNRPITVKADVYSYGMLLLEIVGGRRNLDMSFDAEDFFYPGWAYKEMRNETHFKVADRRLEGAVEEKELMRALKVAFWCIQDEVVTRPTMGDIVRMLEGSMDVDMPPMPQTVVELVEEGLDQVYRAMKRDTNQSSSFTINSQPSSSLATCSHSTISPR
ncbi:G-type lectin S-receptor-like serine/threonine-protein kinase At5g24080 isoform X2 [Cucumis sativus]|uniref:G-type lectin S-receptor-like serine/threonine-protein kinase At5g24080 isoform X2 n=1 Tax=Cucumis sativus TaxID=3659 RepID=UPI0012F4E8AF|nr:G-type lectin S-receptor-like serine/threonine-protein kinase At5g24080 isoform X2 [Cucumis sativus]